MSQVKRLALRCYHQIGMKPEKIGRIAGIGVRLAGRMAGEKLAGPSQAATPTQPSPAQAAQPNPPITRDTGRAAGQMTRGVARGVGGFLRPFGRVGGIIWLEVTGVFFLLFVVVFAPMVWRSRPASLYGPYDRTFITSALVVVVFLYLAITSFLRARRK
jgi:hypothetical protein